jgi:adenylate cyclase
MAALNHDMIVASQPIHAYGGIIDKYMGTEIMALFNTQLNTSDIHQWDAVRAALKIAEAFATTAQPDRERCLRIGIHSGSATMGNIGSKNRREFTAIGDTINLAHRMLEKASYGEILVSQPVLQSCAPFLQESGYATVVDHGMHKIRGREQPTQIFQLLRKGS